MASKTLNYLRSLEFIRSLSVSIKNSPKTLLIIILDLAFFLIATTTKNFAENSIRISGINQVHIIIMVGITIVYYLILLFIYSSIKLSVLNLIKSSITKTRFKIENLIKFYLLNLTLVLIILITSLLISIIFTSAKEEFALLVLAVIVIPYIILAYILVNVSHSAYLMTSSIKKSIKCGLRGIKFSRTYTGIIIPFFFIAAVLSLAFYYPSRINNIINQPLIVIFEAITYAMLLISRTGFYMITQKMSK